MITSRVGEKHRARAIELGVDDYLGKPYQESAAARCDRAAGRAPAPQQHAAATANHAMSTCMDDERVTRSTACWCRWLDGRLIVPRACVAEVVGFQAPSEMPGAPPWYLGTFAWSGRAVPLVSFEGACGQTIPPAPGRTRIVIFVALGTQRRRRLFRHGLAGLPAAGARQRRRRAARSRARLPRARPIICQVRMVNESPLIPDFERLEEMIAEETRAS